MSIIEKIIEKSGYKKTAFGMIDNPIDHSQRVKNIVSEMCMATGKNTMIGYDGVETEEDVEFYLNSILNYLTKKAS